MTHRSTPSGAPNASSPVSRPGRRFSSAPDRAQGARRGLPELLAPAGGPEPFAAALAAGADAIYCGMGAFNARRKADNFSPASFEAACRQAHLAGARVYVTVNVIIKDAEMAEALELVRTCAIHGADAFIIQDWGLFAEVRRLMPELETHISTQANIHDARGAAWCRDRGADRVTLSRELSVDEIAAIAPVGIDLEVFAHGSICFSYSGVCLLSSFNCAGRSANRGMCAQPCRLPYELVDADGRVLSAPNRERPLCPRDTNTSEMLPRLIDAGAAALKLEGRMKAPDYVLAVTDAYRQALDELRATDGADVDPAARSARARQLKRCFNRDFTTAYQDGDSGDAMMSYERSNNRGQLVGEVVAFTPRAPRGRAETARAALKGPAGTARLALAEPVDAGDLLELRPPNDPDRFLTTIARTDAPADAMLDVEIPRTIPVGSLVRIIRSQRAIDAAKAVLKRSVPRRRLVDVHVTARRGEPFTVRLTCVDDPSLSATATGFTVEAARTRAVAREDLIEHVGRMGSTPFEPASFEVELDEGCGMGFSAVHRVRAEACAALEEAILAPAATRAEQFAARGPVAADQVICADTVTAGAREGRDGFVSAADACICAVATSVEAAEAAREAGATRVYLPVDACTAAGLDPDETRARGYVPVLDEVCRAVDHARLDPWVRVGGPVAVGTISSLALAAERGAAAEVRSCIPVHNLACLRFLHEQGARGVWLSPELTLGEIERFVPAAEIPVGLMVWGRPRVMTSEHCILQAADVCIRDCARCGLRARSTFLHNIDDKLLPVRTDPHGRSRLYAGELTDLTPQIPQLAAAGITRFLVDGTLCTPDELAAAVTRARRALEAARAGRRPAPRQAGATAGCLFVGVD